MDVIQTGRLILRNFRKADAAGLLAYLHEPRAGCFLSERLEDLAAAEAEAERRAASDEHVAICLTGAEALIGDMFCFLEEPDTRRFVTCTDSAAEPRSKVAGEMFLATTRTVLLDHAAASSSTKRVDEASAAWARSPCRAPLTTTSSRLVAPGARLGRSQDTSAANSRRPEPNGAPVSNGVPFSTAGAASGSP